MASIGNLEQESIERKDRLKALRLKQLPNEPRAKVQQHNTSEPLPKPIFRSYKPADENLKESLLPKIEPTDVTEKIEDQLLTLGEDDNAVEDIEINNLAPRKPDWDLKRDITQKLDKLERRTQRAIAELIRERLKMDLVTMVNASADAAISMQLDDD